MYFGIEKSLTNQMRIYEPHCDELHAGIKQQACEALYSTAKGQPMMTERTISFRDLHHLTAPNLHSIVGCTLIDMTTGVRMSGRHLFQTSFDQ